MKKVDNEWNVYRTRFLIKAKQLTQAMVFVDALGREHRGQKGDYLMESFDGMRRIAPRKFFEDAYVLMNSEIDVKYSSERTSSTLWEAEKRPPSRVRISATVQPRRTERMQPTA